MTINTTSWEELYQLLGITDFIYFISSPSIQNSLFGIKLIFIAFTVFFFSAVMYFYINSSYIQYQFLQDTTEFLSWHAYGLREITKRWNAIMKLIKSGSESEYKLAIIEADDFLYQVLEEKDFKGDSFEELVEDAGKRLMPDYKIILEAHNIRNQIVYNTDYSLDVELAKRLLAQYETAIKNVFIS